MSSKKLESNFICRLLCLSIFQIFVFGCASTGTNKVSYFKQKIFFEDNQNQLLGYGADVNPTMNPIGGGPGYSNFYESERAPITSASQLVAALENAIPGTVVYVDDYAEIDLSEYPNLPLLEGVVLASGRGRNGAPGGLLFTENYSSSLFIVKGPDVRISGIRLRGADPEIRREETINKTAPGRSAGIHVTYPDFELDNSEIFQWGHGAVYVYGNGNRAYIHHNDIHHNRRWGLGYGVVMDGVEVLIEANMFDWGRHAIAATGRARTAYEARYNWFGPNFYLYQVDMHGGGDRREMNNVAGDWVVMHNNTFTAKKACCGIDHNDNGNIHLSGVPQIGAWIFRNKFARATIQNSVSQREYDVFEGRPLVCYKGREPFPCRRKNNFQKMWVFDNQVTGENQDQTPVQLIDIDDDGLLDIVIPNQDKTMNVLIRVPNGGYDVNFVRITGDHLTSRPDHPLDHPGPNKLHDDCDAVEDSMVEPHIDAGQTQHDIEIVLPCLSN